MNGCSYQSRSARDRRCVRVSPLSSWPGWTRPIHVFAVRVSQDVGSHYCAATLLDDLAAISRSITVRQPVLSSARCLYMQAVIFGMFGISELQRRKASPVHRCCASELKAKPEVDDTAPRDAISVRMATVLRMVRVSCAFMVGSCWAAWRPRF